MTASTASAAPSLGARITRFALVRIVLAALAAIVPVVVIMVLAHQIPDKAMRAVWPQLLSAAACVWGYRLYVRKIEARAVTEFSRPGALHELMTGVSAGIALFAAIITILAALGSYHILGMDSVAVLVKPFAEMAMVAVVEEILFRGVLFRIPERSLGSWAALVISSAIFALAHVPNAGVTVLAVAATVLAGVVFAAAYMATRRLWLPVGLHFGWNYISDAVFSVPTSGQAAKGLLHGQLSGPVWLSGGEYGVEGSVLTVVAMLVAALYLLRLAAGRGQVRAARNGKD
jgi:membrane protease YdiL (CAAX protease family)